VFQVVIYNRKDCCADRLNGFDIYLSSLPDRRETLCYSRQPSDTYGNPLGSVETATCDAPIKASHVWILLPGDVRTHNVAEVKVFGSPLGAHSRDEFVPER